MAQFLFLCFLLANTFLSLAMATNKPQITSQYLLTPSTNPPAQSPSSDQRTYKTEPSIGRKLGKHQHKQVSFSGTPSPSPSEAPRGEKKMHASSEGSIIPNHQKTSVEPHDDEVLGSQGGKVQLLKQHHHSFDKSIAGGGVILGGLATTFLVSIFCYIRATGKHKSETTA